jgi:GTP cyclohydrolase II
LLNPPDILLLKGSQLELSFGKKIRSNTRYGKLDFQYVQTADYLGVFTEGIIVQNPFKISDNTVRIHSSCIFSEALMAIDCDCASQLQKSLRHVATKGGTVFYVIEEGRGIGLAKKFEAVSIQQSEKVSTVEAFARLGYPPDPRSMDFAAAAINAIFGGSPVTVMTNNKHKIDKLSELGVNIRDQKLLQVQGGPLLRDYLIDKRDSLGHAIKIK